jgi:hypothetical protein
MIKRVQLFQIPLPIIFRQVQLSGQLQKFTFGQNSVLVGVKGTENRDEILDELAMLFEKEV